MNPHNEDRLERNVRWLLSAAEKEAVPPDEAFLDRLQKQTLETFVAASAHAPVRPRRYRIMHSKTLKWVVPAAVAAAVVVAVGLWPETGRKGKGTGGSGRVYGMTDVPKLLASAPILHVKGCQFLPQLVPPGQEQTKAAVESWVDLPNGRRHLMYPQHSTEGERTTVTRAETISDGEYEMDVDHAKKTVWFTRLTHFQRLLESHRDFDALLKRTFGDPQQLGNFKTVGQEEIEGRTFTVWEGETSMGGPGISVRCRCWLEPASGEVGRVYSWIKLQNGGADWTPFAQLETIQRLDSAPADTFVTDPPPGYTLANEKASAPYRDMHFEGGIGLGDLSYSGLISFVLEDGSLLFGWSSIDKKGGVPQDDLFKDLTWGGPLPKLPIEIYGFEQQIDSQKIIYTGRHLAYTRKGDRLVEWSLYVPDRTVPASSLSQYYRALHRFNVPKDKVQGTMTTAVSQPFSVGANDFNTLVRGAMAELSDGGVAPDQVTYESVMQLGRQIRESLQQQAR